LSAAASTFISANRSKWEYSNGLYQKHLDLYLDRLYFHLQQTRAASVLDAGCGEGFVYRAMRKRGYRGAWHGFDYNAEAVEFARTSSEGATWQQASAYEIPFADNSFDLVFCSEVLEHLPEPARPLSEFARVSRHWLLLSVPFEPVFRTLTWLSVHLHLGGDPGHVNFWNGSRFRDFTGSAAQLRAWERTTVYQIALLEKRESDLTVGALQQSG
jgi:SAM-dependent methyltransferase